jgi:hypothetical protein
MRISQSNKLASSARPTEIKSIGFFARSGILEQGTERLGGYSNATPGTRTMRFQRSPAAIQTLFALTHSNFPDEKTLVELQDGGPAHSYRCYYSSVKPECMPTDVVCCQDLPFSCLRRSSVPYSDIFKQDQPLSPATIHLENDLIAEGLLMWIPLSSELLCQEEHVSCGR